MAKDDRDVLEMLKFYALRRWLREEIKKLEDQHGGPESLISAESPLDPLPATK